MHQHLETLIFETPGAGLSDITRHVADEDVELGLIVGFTPEDEDEDQMDLPLESR